MAEGSIPVDLLNPGQVFACLGFVEAADRLLGGGEGVFDWSEPSDVRFHVRACGDGSPVEHVLRFLDIATARALAPDGSASLDAWKASWGEPPASIERSRGYPQPDAASPATLVCALSDGKRSILLDHWGDRSGRDNVKFWAGMGGYPGAALARDALALVRGEAVRQAEDPFAFAVAQSSSFRLDWRRDYVPIDAGFSVNEHGHMTTLGYPLVELLGVIGLSHARPRRPEPRNKLAYVYGVCGRAQASDSLWLPLPILRAALGATPLPFPFRRFRTLLDWPGQEGQARSITTVTEETTA